MNIPEGPQSLFRHFSSSPCQNAGPARALSLLLMAATDKGLNMTRTAFIAAELSASIALAASIGLFVSIVLAGITLLLAA